MPATYEPIATTTLGSAATTITFNSIGAGYTDLRLVLTAKNSVADSTLYVRFNNDSGTNYSYTELNGNGSTATSARGTSVAQILMRLVPSAQPAFFEIDVFSYAGSTNKTILGKGHSDQNGSGNIVPVVGLWQSTAAITRIDLLPSGNQFASGTTATLYGILKA